MSALSGLDIKVASCLVPRHNRAQLGHLTAANVHGMRTTRVKRAAWRRSQRRGDFPFYRHKCAPAPLHVGHFAQQGLSVGMHGMRSEEHTSELQSLMRLSYADC